MEDEPPEDVPGVLGLYEGVPLTQRTLDDMTLSDRITLYRGPIERACRSENEVEAEVRLTVLHEVGHFFGLEDEQLE
ncbi:MAG: metallopeptidase family protein [Chloroflexi bacterium]|nr:metallopeptidase family protein [Chloroflexota bacterium]